MRTTLICSTWICIVFAACYTTLADWPEFRGSTGQGLAKLKLPQGWSQTEHVRWRAELPGEGWSSPVIVNDKIFVSAAVKTSQAEDSNFELQLIGLDAQNGELLWQTPLFTQNSEAPKIHQKNSHASPTPIIEKQNLYVHFGHQGTACMDLSGKVLWRNQELTYPPVHGNGGSPIIFENLLIFSRDGANINEVTALNKQTGKIAWQRPRGNEPSRKFSFCTPLIIEAAGRKQLIIPGSDVVQSLDPLTGEEIWRVTYDGYSVVPRPIYQFGLVYICTGYDRPSLLAIDPTGTGDVTKTHLRWQVDSNVPKTPSLIASNGRVLMLSDTGILTALDATSGKELWKHRVGGNFSASPLLVGSQLLVLSEEGDATLFDVANEPLEISKNSLGERCLASPSVVGNDLLIRTAKALYRITAE